MLAKQEGHVSIAMNWSEVVGAAWANTFSSRLSICAANCFRRPHYVVLACQGASVCCFKGFTASQQ